MNQVSTPLANIGAFVGGYKKPFWALVFAGLMFFIGLSLAFVEDGAVFFGFFAVLSICGLLYYYLQKTMFMGFETSGGGTYGFAFKASVLEGVGVDIKRVESTIAYVNSLISSASLGETFVEQAQTQVLGGRQATMLASTHPAAAPVAQRPSAPMVVASAPSPVVPAPVAHAPVAHAPVAPAPTPAAPPAAPPAPQPQNNANQPWPPV